MLLDLAACGIAFFFSGQKPGVHLKLKLIYTVGKNKHQDVKEGQIAPALKKQGSGHWQRLVY